jgi:aspartate aminotransferase
MEMLGLLARDHGLFLVADEVYREFVYDGVEHVSVLGLEGLEDRAIMVDSISKQMSACGARVGCVASRNPALMATLLKFGQARLCPPTIDQIAATAAMGVSDSYYEAVRAEYEQRRDLLCRALSAMPGVICHKPRGAFYTIAKLPVGDAEGFAVFLLDEFSVDGETVMVAPASGFYATPGAGLDEVRIAYVLGTGRLARAMQIFADGLAAFRDRA